MSETRQAKRPRVDEAAPSAYTPPSTTEILDRWSAMSPAQAKDLLREIIVRNEAARRLFVESPLTAPIAAVTTEVPEEDYESLLDNQFVEEICSVQNAVFESVDDVHHWDFQLACEMEATAEEAYQAIASACREEEWRECDCDADDCRKEDTATEVEHKDGHYKLVQVVDYDTKRDGLNALFELADVMLEGKDGVISGILMKTDVGAVVEIMQEIATSLKPEEKEQLRKDRFMGKLDDLVTRIWPYTDAYAEVATIIRK
jgi:hypothetical protein